MLIVNKNYAAGAVSIKGYRDKYQRGLSCCVHGGITLSVCVRKV